MYTLGISCWYHDSAACLLRGHDIVVAVQEERFTRIKHDSAFPENAIRHCLTEAGISPEQLEAVVYYEDSEVKFSRLKDTWKSFFPKSLPMLLKTFLPWVTKKRNARRQVRLALSDMGIKMPQSKVKSGLHHRSHAASAFYPSPFERAAVLVMDGVGEFDTASIWHGTANSLTKLAELEFPNSIGLFYSTITAFLGFKVNSGEYKVMGLAPYGRPTFVDRLESLFDLGDEAESFALNMTYFEFPYGEVMFSEQLAAVLELSPRDPEAELNQEHMDLAASLQQVTERLVERFAARALQLTGESTLCMAGGVALNCVANGLLIERLDLGGRLWIQPAAGDAGNALGCALDYVHGHLGLSREVSASDSMKGALLGPRASVGEIEDLVDKYGAVAMKLPDEQVLDFAAERLAKGDIVGWHQGRAEYGPRSLGGRSILGDPRRPDMQKNMNMKIKFRESFRPFAPAVIREDVTAYFKTSDESPYMLLVSQISDAVRTKAGVYDDSKFGLEKLNQIRSTIPAVTHVDFSARVQTVDRLRNAKFYDLLAAFKSKTGCSVLINTSFNVRGEPIVLTPEDSYRCFMRTEIDLLVIESYVFIKNQQPHFDDDQLWKEEFTLD